MTKQFVGNKGNRIKMKNFCLCLCLFVWNYVMAKKNSENENGHYDECEIVFTTR